jgi:cell division septum initiation protein DivIVA
MNNSGKDGVVTLAGREFKRVKNGLDEAEIKPFIDELIKERDELAQSQHHIAALSKLAETTIVEADRLAKQIKAEASEQAKAESAAVIDKAREQAQQMAERKQAEILKVANEKADAIQLQAEKKSALLLESERDKIRDELRNFVNQQFGYLLEQLESLKQQATAIQADFDNKLSQAGEEKIAETTEIAGEKIAETTEIAGEKIAETTEIAGEEKIAETMEIAGEKIPETMEIAGEKVAETTAIAVDRDAAAMKEDKVPDDSPEPIRDVRQIEKSFDLASILQSEDWAELGEPQWEVEILPPVEITKVMEVMTHLDQLREVANTEMIVPQVDTPSILVFLREEMSFIDMLRTIPAVAYVEEVTTDGDAANGKPRKARIGLSGNAMPQEKK